MKRICYQCWYVQVLMYVVVCVCVVHTCPARDVAQMNRQVKGIELLLSWGVEFLVCVTGWSAWFRLVHVTPRGACQGQNDAYKVLPTLVIPPRLPCLLFLTSPCLCPLPLLPRH